MKKLLASILVCLMVIPIGMVKAQALNPDQDIKVFINNEQISFDIDPIIVNGTTLVQFTPIFNKLGIAYQWVPDTQVINGAKDGKSIRLQINNDIVTVNDYNIKLSATPILYESRTFVPLRFVGEATGMAVDWNQETKEIHINESGNAKTYTKPDYTVYTAGIDFSTDSEQFLKSITIPYDQYASGVYSFFGYKQFGYTSDLHVLINNNDKVSNVSYEFSSSQLNKSVILAYRDIVSQLEQRFGPPTTAQIKQRVNDDMIELKQSISDQELIRGLRNETYYMTSTWVFSDVGIDAVLIHDGSEVKIFINFNEQL